MRITFKLMLIRLSKSEKIDIVLSNHSLFQYNSLCPFNLLQKFIQFYSHKQFEPFQFTNLIYLFSFTIQQVGSKLKR